MILPQFPPLFLNLRNVFQLVQRPVFPLDGDNLDIGREVEEETGYRRDFRGEEDALVHKFVKWNSIIKKCCRDLLMKGLSITRTLGGVVREGRGEDFKDFRWTEPIGCLDNTGWMPSGRCEPKDGCELEYI